MTITYRTVKKFCSLFGLLSILVSNPSYASGIYVDGALLTGKCFSYEWMSSDNYKKFRDEYGLSSKMDTMRGNIGILFGKEITKYGPLRAWGEDVWLSVPLEYCATKNVDDLIIKDDGFILFKDEGHDPDGYRVLATPDENVSCASLAPFIGAPCSGVYTIQVDTDYDDPYGRRITSLYGIFDLPGYGNTVVPLLNDTLKSIF